MTGNTEIMNSVAMHTLFETSDETGTANIEAATTGALNLLLVGAAYSQIIAKECTVLHCS